jgi:predicted nucleic acid-binding protein
LDSWAFVAWLQNQMPAADRMAALLERQAAGHTTLAMHLINVGEVYYAAARKVGDQRAAVALENLRTRGVQFLAVDEDAVLAAARLKARYRISCADAFAAATAMELNAPLATGDPEFRPLEAAGLLRLEWMG